MKIENTKTIVYYTKEDIKTIDNMLQILKVLSQNTVICEQYDCIYMPSLITDIETLKYDLFDTDFHSDLIELREVTQIPPNSEKKKEYTNRDPLGDDYPF